MIGLIVQVVLLGALAGTVGLGPVGWLAGLACGVVTCLLLSRAMARAGVAKLGPADVVTLTRAVLAGGVTALVADSFLGPVAVPALVGVTVVALALDAVDGQVARRTGTVSALGARFDMETDAFLILVLSVTVADSVGLWVLAIGGMRYALAAATWLVPWLGDQVPPRYWRKVVAAIQGIVLVAAVSGMMPRSLVVGSLVVALALLVESFGRDVVWLTQRQFVLLGRAGRVLAVEER